jgi:hypothetical protein
MCVLAGVRCEWFSVPFKHRELVVEVCVKRTLSSDIVMSVRNVVEEVAVRGDPSGAMSAHELLDII